MAAWLAYVLYRILDVSSAQAAAALNAIPWASLFTALPRNAGDLGPVLLFLAAGFGVGDWIVTGVLRFSLRSRVARVAFALCAGSIVWTVAIEAVGMPGHLTRPVMATLLGAGLLATAARLFATRREWRESAAAPEMQPAWVRILTAVAVVLLLVDLYLAFLGALTPEVQFDARFYHLTEAKRYADHGALFNLAASEGSGEMALPQNQETIYAGVYALFGLHAAKLVSWTNLLLSALAIFGFAVEFFASAGVGVLASLIFVSMPIVSWSAATASNDLSLAPYTVLAVYAALLWKDRRARGLLAGAGLLCGFAFGIKPFSAIASALVATFIAVAAYCSAFLFAERRGAAREAVKAIAIFLCAAAAGAAPGMIREYSITGDPFYPLAGAFFHSPFWTPTLAAVNANSIHDFGANTSWPVLAKLPWVLTVHADTYRNVIGAWLLFALPFVLGYAFVRRGHPLFRQLTAFLVVWTVLWFATGYVEARYAECVLPLLALLTAYLAVGPERNFFLFPRAVRVAFSAALLAICALNTQLFVPLQRYATMGSVSGSIIFLWDYLYRGEPERNVQLVYAPMLEYLNGHLDPQRDKVYLNTDDVYFNLYSDIDIYDGVTTLAQVLHPWNLLSTDAYERLRAVDADYVVVSDGDVPALRRAPLFEHLTEVTHIPSTDGKPADGETLYRVSATSQEPNPGGLRSKNQASHRTQAAAQSLSAPGAATTS